MKGFPEIAFVRRNNNKFTRVCRNESRLNFSQFAAFYFHPAVINDFAHSEGTFVSLSLRNPRIVCCLDYSFLCLKLTLHLSN